MLSIVIKSISHNKFRANLEATVINFNWIFCDFFFYKHTKNKQKIEKVGDPNKIRKMLKKIEYIIDYNNSITKILPYIVVKKKTIADVQISEPISIVINIDE